MATKLRALPRILPRSLPSSIYTHSRRHLATASDVLEQPETLLQEAANPDPAPQAILEKNATPFVASPLSALEEEELRREAKKQAKLEHQLQAALRQEEAARAKEERARRYADHFGAGGFLGYGSGSTRDMQTLLQRPAKLEKRREKRELKLQLRAENPQGPEVVPEVYTLPADAPKHIADLKPGRDITAVVVSAGLMQKTVKVRVGTQKWNSHIRKAYNRRVHHLVHDPANSLRLGDIITINSGWRSSKTVRHVVTSIIAPFGEPIDARPPVPSFEDRIAKRVEQRMAKLERRKAQRSPAQAGEKAEVEEKAGGLVEEVRKLQAAKEEAEKGTLSGQVKAALRAGSEREGKILKKVREIQDGEKGVVKGVKELIVEEYKEEEKQADEVKKEDDAPNSEKKKWWF